MNLSIEGEKPIDLGSYMGVVGRQDAAEPAKKKRSSRKAAIEEARSEGFAEGFEFADRHTDGPGFVLVIGAAWSGALITMLAFWAYHAITH